MISVIIYTTQPVVNPANGKKSDWFSFPLSEIASDAPEFAHMDDPWLKKLASEISIEGFCLPNQNPHRMEWIAGSQIKRVVISNQAFAAKESNAISKFFGVVLRRK